MAGEERVGAGQILVLPAHTKPPDAQEAEARGLPIHWRRADRLSGTGILSPVQFRTAAAILAVYPIWIPAPGNSVWHDSSGSHAMDCGAQHESEFYYLSDGHRT